MPLQLKVKRSREGMSRWARGHWSPMISGGETGYRPVPATPSRSGGHNLGFDHLDPGDATADELTRKGSGVCPPPSGSGPEARRTRSCRPGRHAHCTMVATANCPTLASSWSQDVGSWRNTRIPAAGICSTKSFNGPRRRYSPSFLGREHPASDGWR